MSEARSTPARGRSSTPSSLPKGRSSTPKSSLKKSKPSRKSSKSSTPTKPVVTAPSSHGDMLAPHAPRPYRSWMPMSGKSDFVVVLDLDKTLVDSDGFKTSHHDRRYVLDMDDQVIKGSTRPNLKQFLRYLDAYSQEVIPWTAGLKDYAYRVIDVAYEGMDDIRPKRIWHRDQCQFNEAENYYHKPIRQVAEELGYDPKAILIIDDRTCTFVENPHNGLLIPPYEGSNEDDALGRIVDWMEDPKTRYSYTVTQLDKDRVFSH